MNPQYAAFPDHEYRQRFARAKEKLRAAGFDCCICVAPENMFYLGGYDSWTSPNGPQALVFMADSEEPTLVVRTVDLPLALETTWVNDVHAYNIHVEDAATVIANVARRRGLRSGRVAVEVQSYAMPHALGLVLAEAVAPAQIYDATNLLGDLRLIKSDSELIYLRDAGRLANIGLVSVQKGLEPGITEVALAGRLEAAMRAAGSDYWSVPTELASGPRTPGGHATPYDRVIQPGDLVHTEFAGVARRYHAVAIHTMSLGDPGARARDIYRLTLESLRAAIKVVRPGVAAGDVEEASLEPIRKEGLEQFAMMRFGYGIGIGYPPIWLETLTLTRGQRRPLEVGMAFVMHACLELLDEKLGVVVGGTYLLTKTGLEMLAGSGDQELQVV